MLGLRQYLRKALSIVDDFHFENEWGVFETAMRRVLPAARSNRSTSRTRCSTASSNRFLRVPYPGRLGERGLIGEFYGSTRQRSPPALMVVINYNIDLGDYVEWSGQELYNPQSTNEAYKFMVNYVIYGMTH